ncbi:Fe2OG dioxygenase domain-containing protein [Fagus crenata]
MDRYCGLDSSFCGLDFDVVFFPEVGGSTLDSHHGFVVEYGMDRDVELGFHVDDSEVTLNVCLGRKVLVLCFILRYLFFSLSPT